jgi:hypothetical protein
VAIFFLSKNLRCSANDASHHTPSCHTRAHIHGFFWHHHHHHHHIQHYHYGGPEYQTEVALLSRSITLQGGPQSESRSKGGHVKVMGQARMQGVAAFRMGQRNLVGFYPFHFHHLGWVNGESYVSDCAVYNSFYRCFVVHGTHNLLLKDNVAFHAAGHCYYLEDGVEEHNRFEHNLAAFVHVIGSPAGGPSQDGTTHVQDWSSLAQPADAAASGFYASNSNNEFVGNAASGGWAGYSFPRLEAPIGDYSWMTQFIPHQRPLKLFDGNTVHSTACVPQAARARSSRDHYTTTQCCLYACK